jgi:peptidoglycan/LPS O-acetylase OafA/YrhL
MDRSIERPWTVALGCAVSLAISVWDVVSSISEEELVDSHYFLALLVAMTVIPVIFTLAAFFRRNWARIALAVLTAIGLVSAPLFAMFWEDMAGPIDTETVLYSITELVVIVLLFVPASNEWYRRSLAPSSRPLQ